MYFRRASLLMAGAFALSCASANVSEVRDHGSASAVRPPVMLINGFAVSPEDVVLDTLGPGFLGDGGSMSDRLKLGHQVSRQLKDEIVKALNERGITARRANRSTRPELNALVVKGQFLTIDEGDATGRTVVGFGSGATEIRVRIQLYQATPHGLRRLREGVASAAGSKKPGMLVPVAGGAIAGTAATSAIVSGGMSLVSEATGVLDRDIKRLAGELADRAEKSYAERGW